VTSTYSAACSAEGSTGTFTPLIQQVDPAAGTARIAGRLPYPVAHATAVVLDGQILILGGSTPQDPTPDILRFDPTRQAISHAGRLPTASTDGAVAAIGDTGYLIGGLSATGPLDQAVVIKLGLSARPAVQANHKLATGEDYVPDSSWKRIADGPRRPARLMTVAVVLAPPKFGQHSGKGTSKGGDLPVNSKFPFNACRTCGRGSRGTAVAKHLPGAWRPGHSSRSAARSARSGSAARCAATLRTAEHRQRRFSHGLAGQPGALEKSAARSLIRFPAELGPGDPASLPHSGPGSPFQRRHAAPLGADDPRLRQPPRIGGQEPIIMPDGSVRPPRLTGRWRARALSSAGTG
jgi:hypothetical protein